MREWSSESETRVRESRTRRLKARISRASVEGMVKQIREANPRFLKRNKARISRASVEGIVKRIREANQRVMYEEK